MFISRHTVRDHASSGRSCLCSTASSNCFCNFITPPPGSYRQTSHPSGQSTLHWVGLCKSLVADVLYQRHAGTDNAAKVTIIVVISNAMAQITMQRQGIKLILQIIAVCLHRRCHSLLGVSRTVFTQPVGFIVEQVITPFVAGIPYDKEAFSTCHVPA